MGIAENKKWREVLENLAPLPQKGGVYETFEGVENMWEKLNYEHPALIGTFGMLRGDGTDPSAIRRTLDKIDATWNFDRVWGWDFPMLAMARHARRRPRARDRLPAIFIAALFMGRSRGCKLSVRLLPRQRRAARGGCDARQRLGRRAPADPDALHFPKNGKWKVRAEGFGQKHQ